MLEHSKMIKLQHQKSFLRRGVSGCFSSYRNWLILLWLVGFGSVFLWQRNIVKGIRFFRFSIPLPIPRLRPHVFNLTNFGGVGDGVWMNTKAFEDYVATIAKLGNEGGQLNVQAGVWLTAPFNFTSHMTLFLAEDVVILGVEISGQIWLSPPEAEADHFGWSRKTNGALPRRQ